MKKKLLTIIMAIALAMTFFAFVACDNANGSNGNGTSTGTGNDSNNQGGQELPQLNPILHPQVLGLNINFMPDSRAEQFRLGFMYWYEEGYAEAMSLDELLENEFFYIYIAFSDLVLLGGNIYNVSLHHLVDSGDLPRGVIVSVFIISIGREGVHRNSAPVVAGAFMAPAI